MTGISDENGVASRLDYSMFSPSDLLNIILQRSEVLWDIPQSGRLIRGWVAADAGRLEAEVKARGPVLAARAAAQIGDEADALASVLDGLAPARLADIGCGYAFFDLFAHRRFGCSLLLVDIEKSDQRHFGFQDVGAGYASLKVARKFLVANGVPDDRISAWNPERGAPAADQPVDLAVSLLSCGFHYPVDTYMPFFREKVAPGGAMILDLRAAVYDQSVETLSTIGRVEKLSSAKGRWRVIVRKG